MNIFVLDKDFRKCARYHCDKHVVKMILESAQILCTVSNLMGLTTPYRSTHIKHLCVKWAMQSIQNWCWLRRLASALNEEFKFRFGHKDNHKAYTIIENLEEPPLPNIGLTEHPQAMPDIYKAPGNPVQAYRNYYVAMKRPFATWKRRRQPKWYLDMIGKKKWLKI